MALKKKKKKEKKGMVEWNCLPILANFEGVMDIEKNSAIIVNEPCPCTVRASCQSSRGGLLLCHGVKVGFLLRSEGAEHGACLVDHDSGFPNRVDARETGDDVVANGEEELELVVGAFFERESVSPGVGGERKWHVKLFSSSNLNP